jgi:RNA polymerase sigma-70 factor (ECF subfamily)
MVEEPLVDEGSEFEEHRRYLSAVAYRLLGSLADAEDAVQDTWLRWRSVERSTIQDPRAFLTKVVTRVCYDQLRSARARREAYYGEWLPEPLVDRGPGSGSASAIWMAAGAEDARNPEELATLRESVSYAMLAVMEQLGPAERAAFVLHDVFEVGFDEIAEALGRTPDAVRQLASRARRRMKERTTQRSVDRDEHSKAVAAFAAASVHGDLPGLLAVLDPNVVWHSDGGGVVSASARPVVGADRVAHLLAGLTGWWAKSEIGLVLEQVEVNGAPGLAAFDREGAAIGVIAFEAVEGRITAAYVVLNPEKVERAVGAPASRFLPRRSGGGRSAGSRSTGGAVSPR